MAIVKMSKFRLVCLDYDKEEILNALYRTGKTEVTANCDLEDTFLPENDCGAENCRAVYERTKGRVDFLSDVINKCKDKPFFPKEQKNFMQGFFVSYDEFLNVSESDYVSVINKLEDYEGRLTVNRSDRTKTLNLLAQIEPYCGINERFSDFKDTKYTRVFFGTVKEEKLAVVENFVAAEESVGFEVLKRAALSVISIVCLKTDGERIENFLQEVGFAACEFDFYLTPDEKTHELEEKIKDIDADEEELYKKVCKRASSLKGLKILSDKYKFQLEKAERAKTFRYTGKTVVIEGYCPEVSKDEITAAVTSVTDAVFTEFSSPAADDTPPTLTKNNPVVRQVEFITDMYSVPNYRELDPSKVVFFFFMLFMGIIMADVGYGVIMILFGLFLAKRIKVDNGARRLWYIVTIGGIFSIIFGLLFNSFFGVSVLPINILPNPTPDLETGRINLETIMTLLLACLALGAVQLAVGYFCKAINCFKSGKVLDGILDGMLWVIFFVAMIFATFNFLTGYLGITVGDNIKSFFNVVQTPALYTLIGVIVIAALTAGRHEKGFGKFTKGFGAVYGLINIMSDILSYARLFGLMLSGMIIAQTFNYKLGLPMIAGGGVGVVIGVIVIVVGHVFNIAMNVLGAYIHDSRLQYIEFFSKFYTGEGEKFTPLGSKTDFIYVGDKN